MCDGNIQVSRLDVMTRDDERNDRADQSEAHCHARQHERPIADVLGMLHGHTAHDPNYKQLSRRGALAWPKNAGENAQL